MQRTSAYKAARAFGLFVALAITTLRAPCAHADDGGDASPDAAVETDAQITDDAGDTPDEDAAAPEIPVDDASWTPGSRDPVNTGSSDAGRDSATGSDGGAGDASIAPREDSFKGGGCSSSGESLALAEAGLAALAMFVVLSLRRRVAVRARRPSPRRREP